MVRHISTNGAPIGRGRARRPPPLQRFDGPNEALMARVRLESGLATGVEWLLWLAWVLWWFPLFVLLICTKFWSISAKYWHSYGLWCRMSAVALIFVMRPKASQVCNRLPYRSVGAVQSRTVWRSGLRGHISSSVYLGIELLLQLPHNRSLKEKQITASSDQISYKLSVKWLNALRDLSIRWDQFFDHQKGSLFRFIGNTVQTLILAIVCSGYGILWLWQWLRIA